MSTVDDTLPYMQAWLDSRPIQQQARTEFTAAQTAVTNARNAIQARVTAGDTVQQMKPLVDTYASTRTTYIAKDAALQTAQANTANAAQAFEYSVELLARGETIPPLVSSLFDTTPTIPAPPPVPSPSGGGTGTGIELFLPEEEVEAEESDPDEEEDPPHKKARKRSKK